MCNCCLVPCCCLESSFTINTPAGYSEPPKNIICPQCNKKTSVVYKKDRNVCFLCCIPCIPLNSSNPYMACSVCNYKITAVNYKECSNCKVCNFSDFEYCCNCGKRI